MYFMLYAMVCHLIFVICNYFSFERNFTIPESCNCCFGCLLGYDPALVNPYLPKVLENLGSLVYGELENEGQIYFNITSVVSSHGEQLMLKQVNALE